MTREEAIALLVLVARDNEWTFDEIEWLEDERAVRLSCGSCGAQFVGPNYAFLLMVGLTHKQGCRMSEAIEMLDAGMFKARREGRAKGQK